MTETASLDTPTLGVFLLVTVTMCGGAAWMAGSGFARSWRPFWHCVLASLALGAVSRFLHYALFSGSLLSGAGYSLDAAVALVIGALGFRLTRVRQMTSQYRWLYERAGPLSWRERQSQGT